MQSPWKKNTADPRATRKEDGMRVMRGRKTADLDLDLDLAKRLRGQHERSVAPQKLDVAIARRAHRRKQNLLLQFVGKARVLPQSFIAGQSLKDLVLMGPATFHGSLLQLASSRVLKRC